MSTAAAAQSTGGSPSTAGTQSTGVPASTAAQLMPWGDDWRARMAVGSTDSAKEMQQLERYESPEQIWRKARELEKRMSSGELRSVLKPGASQDETAKWRAENGLPADSKGYKVNMPQGRELPKEDSEFIDTFMKSAHAANFSQAQVDTAIANFYTEIDRQERVLTEDEQLAVTKSDEVLRQAWGADYTLNKNLAESFLSRAPAGFRDRFWNGYLADHQPIRASPDMWKWLVQSEREINPAATVVPNQTTGLGQTIAAEIAQIKALMGAPKGSVEYKKYWSDEKLQARYRQLLEAQQGIQKKTAQPA